MATPWVCMTDAVDVTISIVACYINLDIDLLLAGEASARFSEGEIEPKTASRAMFSQWEGHDAVEREAS
jgi:hypothetical protein